MKKNSQALIREDAFYVIAAANGRVLEVANFNPENGAAVQIWNYAGEPWQQWSFVAVGEDTYRLKNRFTGKVIDLAMRGTDAGTHLHQWSETGHSSQMWTLEPGTRGVRLRNVYTDKYLDLAQMGTANGTPAQIWNSVEGGSQEWNIRRVDDKPSAQKAEKTDGAAPAMPARSADMLRKIASAGKDVKQRGKQKKGKR